LTFIFLAGFLEQLSGLQYNVSLAEQTTFRIGGPAKYFYLARNKEKLIKAVEIAHKNNCPYFVFGGGSNVLFDDKGFDGLIIKFYSHHYKIEGNQITAEAGVPLSEIVFASIKAGLAGLEWAVGIPGTVGGAVYGNSGAFNYSLSQIVEEVISFSPLSRKEKHYKPQECQFGYRDSIFRKNKEILLLVKLKLRKGLKEESQKIIQNYLKIRHDKIPPFPSAGSVFKNYSVKKDDEILKKFPQLKEKMKKGKIPAACFIEQVGLKGRRIGDAQIFEKHANIIVNLGQARSQDVLALMQFCKEKVKKKFDIDLKEEIQIIT